MVTLLSTVIVMFMYTYTINSSLDTVRKDIQANNLNRLRFMTSHLDRNVEQLNMLATSLEADPKVALLPSINLMDNYEQVQLMLDLTAKMNLQSFSGGWTNQISIYSRLLEKWIGSTRLQEAPPDQGQQNGWKLDTTGSRFIYERILDSYVIRISFPKSNLSVMLDSAAVNGSESFFYHPDYPVIAHRSSDSERVNEVLAALAPQLTGRTEGTETILIGEVDYMVNFLMTGTLGWYMIDYLPLDQALQPIKQTQTFFYIACVLLFLGGIFTLLFLYRKVQVPIVTLLKGVRLLKHGDFSFRIRKKSRNEFDILYESFNDMAAQIEDLIEKVYKEKIISREALIKQLQAQINPHFLYNCLFFIDNMTRLGNDKAVIAMTKNLAEYFRYTTRLNEPMTTLEKELGVVENYLNIQCLRMDRLHYEIDIPDSMRMLPVPKLLIQPLVENSVIHGIEKKRNAGLIRITGAIDKTRYRIIVEDDGKGMNETDLGDLLKRIEQPLDDSIGCALWNIRQRMGIHFEAPAGMEIESIPSKGLSVKLYWSKGKEG
ncbi:sensor histidine kinase [Paenibacillus lactis]|uniref:sensor histidine kinase n=1 Tax=Paenibacillus lactis TaxID=228574 RepID=UPI001BCFBF73|nr:sensor histidine kinase [Paenibacillus lactis]